MLASLCDGLRRFRAHVGGISAVEFAMILPILVLLLFAVIEFGMAFWQYQQVSAAASEGARRASVSRTYGDRDQRVIDAVKESSPSLDADQLDVAIDSTWNSGDPVTVTVSYPEEITILGVTFFSDDLTIKRTMRVEQ
ncbi:MAG: pilus assembly protein [Thermoleophilia bacterium]|nr:pilus assembly protein [Thermoleophilia bacterium]